MTNHSLIEDIEQNFTDLLTNKRGPEIKTLVNSIVRAAGRIKTGDKELQNKILKVAQDLRSTESSEGQFYKLQNPGNKSVVYSRSFFRSVTILKNELTSLLKQVKD